MNLNNVTLVGRVATLPETRFTPNNVAVCNFTLAVDSGYGDNKNTAFVGITCWQKTAEAVQQYAVKGQEVGIVGELRMDSWEDRESGQKRSKLYVNANAVQFGQKPKGHEDGTQQAAPARQQGNTQQRRQPVGAAAASQHSFANAPPIDEDDIPF